MTTDRQKAGDEEPDDAVPEDGDMFLVALVSMVNDGDALSFPLTLNVRGTLGVGQLAPVRAYFEAFGTQIARTAKSLDDAERARIRDTFIPPDAKDSGQSKAFPEFIHLRDAQIYTGNTFVPTSGGGAASLPSTASC